MTTHKATAQRHGSEWFVHTFNENYQMMEEIGPYSYWKARSLASDINNEAKVKAKAERQAQRASAKRQ